MLLDYEAPARPLPRCSRWLSRPSEIALVPVPAQPVFTHGPSLGQAKRVGAPIEALIPAGISSALWSVSDGSEGETVASVMGFCPVCQRTVHMGERDDRVCPVCSTPLMVTELGEQRVERLGKNEARFREANEAVERTAQLEARADERIDYVCECGAATCSAFVQLTLEEYEAVRHHAARFVQLPGHDIPEIERIVHESDGYVVVEKIGEGRKVAEALDPRSSA